MAERRGPTDQKRFKRVRKVDEAKIHGGRVGAPLKLTQEIQDTIVKFIRAGSYLETAARAAGISKVTLYSWMNRAHRGEPDFILFMNSVEKAMAEVEIAQVAGLLQAGGEHWQARAWWLERTKSKKFGRQVRVEGDEDNPLNVRVEDKRIDLDKLSVEELRELKRLRAKVRVSDDDEDENGDED